MHVYLMKWAVTVYNRVLRVTPRECMYSKCGFWFCACVLLHSLIAYLKCWVKLEARLFFYCRSQWPRRQRRRSAAARLLRSWVRIPPGAWTFVYFECCVLSGRGLCDGLITCPEEFYRLRRVVVCDLIT